MTTLDQVRAAALEEAAQLAESDESLNGRGIAALLRARAASAAPSETAPAGRAQVGRQGFISGATRAYQTKGETFASASALAHALYDQTQEDLEAEVRRAIAAEATSPNMRGHTDAMPCPGCVAVVSRCGDGCNDAGGVADYWHAKAMKAAVGRPPRPSNVTRFL